MGTTSGGMSVSAEGIIIVGNVGWVGGGKGVGGIIGLDIDVGWSVKDGGCWTRGCWSMEGMDAGDGGGGGPRWSDSGVIGAAGEIVAAVSDPIAFDAESWFADGLVKLRNVGKGGGGGRGGIERSLVTKSEKKRRCKRWSRSGIFYRGGNFKTILTRFNTLCTSLFFQKCYNSLSTWF